MAKIFTTPTGPAKAKAWFHDMAVLAGLIKNQRSGIAYWTFLRQNAASVVQSCSELCTELIERNFTNVDNALKILDNKTSNIDFSGNGRNFSASKEDIAKYLVYMAQELDLVWDDTFRTPYEIEDFKKTILGEAVYRYGQVASMQTTASAGTTRTTTPKAPGTPPKNDYKSQGPQSSNARDLISQPGQKQTLTGRIYKIVGSSPTATATTPSVFIRPLDKAGDKNGTNKVFFGVAQGYKTMTCYFTDHVVADTFLQKCLTVAPANITNLHVVATHADRKGYFEIGTEFGPCYVAAQKMNEELEDAAEEIVEDMGGWDKVAARSSKEELDEIHRWRRKD